MKAETVTMNPNEIEPLHWMRLLADKRTTQRQAAEALRITPRHLRRLYEAYAVAGAGGLTSKRRGLRSNRATPDETRLQALPSFGPCTRTSGRRSPSRLSIPASR